MNLKSWSPDLSFDTKLDMIDMIQSRSFKCQKEPKRLFMKSGAGNRQKGSISGAENRQTLAILGPWMSQKGSGQIPAPEIAKKGRFPAPERAKELYRIFMGVTDAPELTIFKFWRPSWILGNLGFSWNGHISVNLCRIDAKF